MFISSMARKNKQNRSKSAAATRKCTPRQRKQEQNVDGDDDDDDGGKPPQSLVHKSDVIFVNGSSKKLLKIRDINNLSNSAKTIRPSHRDDLPPNSKVETTLNPLAIKSDDNLDDNISGELSGHLEEKLLLGTSGLSLANSQRKQTRLGFIDSPEDAQWYLDPLHRSFPYDDRSLSRSYQIRNLDAGIYNVDYDELGVDLQYLEKSKIIEQEALARAAIVTPYELELCRLRKEKLKLEESYLLKQKCDNELERTRGPKPKWYELKTRQFTEEMEKYDNVMNNRKYWNQLIDYRNDLSQTSRQLSTLR